MGRSGRGAESGAAPGNRASTAAAGERLLVDLEAQHAHAQRREQQRIAAELVRAERGGLTMEDRLSGAIGCMIGLQLRSGERLSGRVDRVGDGWVELAGSGMRHVVQLSAVRMVDDLPARTRPAGDAVRQSLRSRLREVEERGRPVTVACDGAVSYGLLIGVWRDHIELQLVAQRTAVPGGAGGGAAGRAALMMGAVEWVRC